MTSLESREYLAPVTFLFGGSAPIVPEAEAETAEPAATVFFADLSESTSRASEQVQDDDGSMHAGSGVGSGERRTAAERRADRDGFLPINNLSMKALGRKGMSSEEMRSYLLGREFEADVVDGEIERLECVGLLDDRVLADTLVRTLRDRKGLGKSALTAELRRRKLDPLAIENALTEAEEAGDDELARATEIALKRAPQLRSLDSDTAKRRLSAFLMRRGYSGSVVSGAVAAALAPSGPVFR